MKIYLSGMIALATVLMFNSSCQKEVEGVLGENNNEDSTIIRKYIEFDTTLSIGLDTLSIMAFDYDNRGRLISTKQLEKDQTMPPTSTLHNFRNTFYFYNTNESLPNKVISSSSNQYGTMNDTVFLFYTGGWVSNDSIRTKQIDAAGFIYESIVVNRYVRNGNATVATEYRANTFSPPTWPPACPRTTNYQHTVSSGNIISEIGNSTSCNSTGRSVGNYSYDNKPSPFYILQIPYPVLDGYLTYSYVQKNNIIESWFTTPGDGFINTYTYRSDGYPIIVRSFEVADPTNSWKGLLFYK